MANKEHRRTKAIFIPQLKDVFLDNKLMAIEPFDAGAIQESCCMNTFYLGMTGNQGTIDMSVGVRNGRLECRQEMGAKALALLKNVQLPMVTYMGATDGWIRISFEIPRSKDKTEVAMDLYIRIFQTLGFAFGSLPTIPPPRIGRFTEVSTDEHKTAWRDFGNVLLEKRRALGKS
jgi:hypothetical protein